MKRFLERNLPPGYNYKPEFLAIIGLLIWVSLSSLIGFFIAYSHERQALFIRAGTQLFLDESKTMPDFMNILGTRLRVYFIFGALILLFSSAIHYVYYYKESKSIYLMRRLTSRSELHRRSLLIPLLCALVFAAIAFILLLIFYAVYMNSTPKVCLTPDQWQKIWSVSVR